MIPKSALTAFLRGTPVREDKYIPEFKEAHRKERKWARRVKHARYRRFDVRMERVVFFFEGTMFVHPNTYKILVAALKNIGATFED
jgi:hypothetical protein